MESETPPVPNNEDPEKGWSPIWLVVAACLAFVILGPTYLKWRVHRDAQARPHHGERDNGGPEAASASIIAPVPAPTETVETPSNRQFKVSFPLLTAEADGRFTFRCTASAFRHDGNSFSFVTAAACAKGEKGLWLLAQDASGVSHRYLVTVTAAGNVPNDFAVVTVADMHEVADQIEPMTLDQLQQSP